MANPTRYRTFGIDVSKRELVLHDLEQRRTQTLDNTDTTIAAWLDAQAGPLHIALEPTGRYHLAVLHAACARGHRLYLINPRQLVHYRESVNARHKDDPTDAYLLARFLDREIEQLTPVSPPSQAQRRLWALIKRRRLLVTTQTRLSQSLRDVGLPHAALTTQINTVIARIDRHIQTLIRRLGLDHHYRRCRSIPGIGPVNAAALTAAYDRGHFQSADAFIAYLGLDIRRHQSGTFKGKAKLTKRGEPELRRLLYCAAIPARCLPRFKAYHQTQLERGRSKIAANVALARKLARIAFALMSQQQDFNPNYT